MTSKSVALAFQDAVRHPRETLYAPFPDKQLPLHLQDDARLPMVGFAGANFKLGNPVLLAINPGGGTDNYRMRTAHETELFSFIHEFCEASGPNILPAFERMSANYAKQAREWNIRGIMSPVLDSLYTSLDQVAFVNAFPYRTRKDAKPHAHPLRQAITRCTVPLLQELRPQTLVCLGKKAGDAMASVTLPDGVMFVVPRTNGDRYLSTDAQIVLKNLRQYMERSA